jgi:hypothetical protein
MKKLYPVLAIVCLACNNEPVAPPDSVIAAFNNDAQTAKWLHEYSRAGKPAYAECMRSANDIVQKPGFVWFGFKENTLWHFIFGYVIQGEFSVKFHYTVDGAFTFETK